MNGLDRLDSWSTDGHKLLNVAYDCGIAICRHAAAHRAAMSIQAAYLELEGGGLDPMDWSPEFSRRARGVGVYATLRALGRDGVAGLVDRAVRLAHRFAGALEASGCAVVVNDWASDEDDVDRAVEALLRHARAAATPGSA